MSNTPCKNCTFAIYDDVTQTGCSRGMLDKFKAVGANIIEAYDQDKEFYVIENRICPFNRSEAWADHLEANEAIERMLKFETQLGFHVMIFIEDDIEPVKKTIDTLLAQDQKPLQVTIIRPRTSMIKPREVADLFENCPFKWRVENLWKTIKKRQAIHMVQKVVKANYYVVAQAGYEFAHDFLSSINEAVIDNLLQFAMIEDGDTRVIPLGVHEYWHFQGNVELTIPENVKEYQCENKEQKIIFTMQEVRNHSLRVSS